MVSGKFLGSEPHVKESILKTKSFGFALRIVKLYKFLAFKQQEYVMSKQVLRSGTSIGANVEEGNQAQSKADFIHKLSIAQKEAFETDYWLRLLRESDFITKSQAVSLIEDCRELQKLLSASIKTAKRNLAK